MNPPSDDRLLAFLEGELGDDEREALLEALARDDGLAEELRSAAHGLEAMKRLRQATVLSSDLERVRASRQTRASRWPIVIAAAASLLVAIPTTWWVANSRAMAATRTTADLPPTTHTTATTPTTATTTTATTTTATTTTAAPTLGQPVSPDPSFMLVLHGRWPDAEELDEAEVQRRADTYWAWTTSLAEQDVLLAAGDLRWEPGERLGPLARPISVSAAEVTSETFVVGVFAIRAGSYDEAMAIARDCPHLAYGGSVSLRQVGGGFVTTAGFGDWGVAVSGF